MSEKIFEFIIEASVTAGIAAAAAALAGLFIKRVLKASVRWAYMLWAVVFFRCLCPVSVESGLSVFNLLGRTAVSEEAAIPSDSEGEINLPASFKADDVPSEIVFTPSGAEAGVNTGSKEKNDSADVYTVLLMLWGCGAAAMAAYGIISSAALAGRLKTAVKAEDGVFESDRISTAFTAGVFRPRIYLPCGLPENQRELIILHERVHIRRRDYILKPIAFAGLALHWFNPLIWAAFALMTRDMEMSCDEAALKICGSDKRTDYSEALLNASVRKSGIAASIGFGEIGIKERVKNVLYYKKPRLAATVLAAAVMLTACAAVGTDAKDTETDILSDTAAVGNKDNGETGKYVKDITNEDTSKYFPVNSKGQTYGGGTVKDENGDIVYPDLIAAHGKNGIEGYITKEALLLNSDEPCKYISGIRAELVSEEMLDMYRERYKDSRDDYKELRLLQISSEMPMYDSEGEPIDDVFCGNHGVYVLGEYIEFEIVELGAKITIDEAGNVKAESKDGNKIKVDSYIPKTVFDEVTGKVKYMESHPALSETNGVLEHEDTPNGGTLSHSDSDEESGAVHFDKWEEEEKPNGGTLNHADGEKPEGSSSEDYYLWDLQQEEEAKYKPLETESDRQKEEQQRLREEEEAMAKELKNSPEYRQFLEDIDSSRKLKKPVDSEIIEPYSEGDSDFHKGVDFKVKEGDTVCAADSGKVIAASDKNNGYGICVIIDHGNGMATLYAHLSEASVSVDDEVKQGDEIGKAGHTGNTFGDGLHFEVRIDGQHTDPMNYLDN